MVKKKQSYKKFWFFLLIGIGIFIIIYLLLGILLSPLIKTSVSPILKVIGYPLIFLSGDTGGRELQDPIQCESNNPEALCSKQLCEQTQGTWTFIDGFPPFNEQTQQYEGGICRCDASGKTGEWVNGIGCK